MLVIVLGTPSPLTYAATNAVRALTDACLGDLAFMSANTLSELRRVWLSVEPRERRVVVLCSDLPHPDLLDVLSRSGAPILVSAEGVADIVDFMMLSREWNPSLAARLASNSIAALEPMIAARRTKLLLARDKGRPLDEFLADLADFYEMECDAETIRKARIQLSFEEEEASATLGDLVQRAVLDKFDHLSGRLAKSQEEAELVATFARDYDVILRKSKVRDVTWPRAIFLKVEPRDAPLDGPVSLLGPARFLTYGPYLHLPAGEWRATVEIEAADCYSENRLSIDVCAAGVVVAAVTTTLPAFGVFACDMQFRLDDPMSPVESRLRLLTGAIEGQLLLRSVRFRRIDEDEDAKDQRAAMLLEPR